MAPRTRYRFSLLFSLVCLVPLSSAGSLPKRTTEELQSDVQRLSDKVRGNGDKAQKLRSSLLKLKSDIGSKITDDDSKEQLEGLVSTASGVIEKFQSGDPMEIISGCVDLASGLGEVIGKLAPMLPALMVLSTIFAMIKGEEAQESVADVVKKALKEQRDDELEAEAYATKKIFAVSKAFIDGVRDEERPLSETEVAALASNIPIYQGVKMMSLLGQRIKKAEPTTKEEAQRIVTFISLLIKLTSVRDVILMDMYVEIMKAKHSPNIAAGVNEVRKISKDEIKSAMKAIFVPDNPKIWLLLACLYPRGRSADTMKIFKYFDSNGIEGLPKIDDDLSGRKILSPKAYPDNCMKSQSNVEWLMGNKKRRYNSNGECTLRLAKTSEGYYTMTVNPSRNAYAGATYINAANRRADKLSKFLFLPVKKGYSNFYIITTCEWPDKFAYMQANNNGWIAFYTGNPDDSGYQEKAFWLFHDA